MICKEKAELGERTDSMMNSARFRVRGALAAGPGPRPTRKRLPPGSHLHADKGAPLAEVGACQHSIGSLFKRGLRRT